MTLIQYFLFANIYILAFWICYRIALKKLGYFNSIRIYLNAALVLSSLLPLIQFSIADLLGSTSLVSTGQELPALGIVYQYQLVETLPVTSGHSYNWTRIIEAILIAGSGTTALIYIFIHLRIHSLIRKSSCFLQLENGLKAMMSDDVSIPFVYFNRIVIPRNITENDISQTIAHETMHHYNKHHLDNLLYSLLHVIFWANPIFLLLRKAQKLNHEFQVDNQMLSSGVDPVSYKLSLVKYSGGQKLFALANGLSSTNTRHRIMKINNPSTRKGKWRFFILIPAIIILFAFFTSACIEPVSHETPSEVQSEALLSITPDDTLKFEFIDPKEGTDVVWDKNSVIFVLMNKDSKIMIAGEELLLQSAEQKIISEYNKKLAYYEENPSRNIPENGNTEIKVNIQKDLAADIARYQKLLDDIIAALLKLRDMHSIRLYDGLYATLTESQKQSIATLIPLRIYGSLPKNFSGMDTPPQF